MWLRQDNSWARHGYSAVTHMPDLDPEAIRANDAGVALADERRYAEAAPFYEQVLALAPGWYAPHLNLGIARKQTGDWARSLAASIRAHRVTRADCRPSPSPS